MNQKMKEYIEAKLPTTEKQTISKGVVFWESITSEITIEFE